MDEAEFGRLLALGLGRAILHLHDHDATLYREVILQACLHNTVYDTQTNNSREQYLYDVIVATGEPDFYRTRLLAAATALPDDEDGEQILSLLRLFAAHGDAEARQRLSATFAANVGTDKPDGSSDLVELDGLSGLLIVAAQLRLDPDDAWYASYLTGIVADQIGQEATSQALNALAATNPTAAAFVALVESEQSSTLAARANRDRSSDPLPTYPHIQQLLVDGDPNARSLLWRWGRDATDEELAQAAADLLVEEDPWRLGAYLRLFRRRRFRLDYARLVERAHSADPQIAAPAISVLANITTPEIRALGLELLTQRNGNGASLLTANFRDDDFLLLEHYLNEWQDADEVHSLGMALKHIVEAHPLTAATGALLVLYERGPCTLCRNRVVKLLAELGPLPEWLIAECQYDANLELRAWVQQYRHSTTGTPAGSATPPSLPDQVGGGMTPS